MKKIFYLLLFFLSYWSVAQSQSKSLLPCANQDDISKPLNPKGIIADNDSKTRINIYRNFKNSLNLGPQDINSINYTPCGFLNLMKALIDPIKKYDGLRVYFGSDPNNKDTLMLIFVPTTGMSGSGIHTDDLNACWVIQNDNITILDETRTKIASKYVKEFDNMQLKNKFTPDGQRYYDNEPKSKTYYETKSLWYPINLFNAQTTLNPTTGKYETGQYKYLQYLINTNAINNVVVDFGGYEASSQYDYQLTLVFDYSSANGFTSNPFFFGSKAYSKKRKHHEMGMLGSNTDNAVPCPPPPSGTKCPGALLPQ